VELVGRSGRSLDQIIIQTREVQGLIDQIVVSARDQANGLLQVNRAVAQMDQTTQSNAAMVEQASAAGVSLADEAVRLSELVGSFRLGEPGAGSRVAA
jgi:methyl-accepting chemotaxis protein